jgi:hypothetical protein
MVDRPEVAKARREAEELLARPFVPHEPALVRKEWRLPEPAREPRERGLDTNPNPEPDWDAWNSWCDERIKAAEAELIAALGEQFVEERATMREEQARLRSELLAELAELRVTVANVRVQQRLSSPRSHAEFLKGGGHPG